MISDREIREKLVVSGPEKLSDAELLAVIIREGGETISALQLAENILAEFSGSLSDLAEAGVGRIRRTAGCGTTKAVSIAAAAELARRISAEKALTINSISSKADVEKLFAPLAELGHEEFWVLYLTSAGRVIERTRLSQGGVAGTVVDHKLVVKRAVELLASSIILVHNHPSGLARPSRDDESITETVSAAAALFDINVIDHIIISRSGNYSFAENSAMPSKR
jgi:DNA repair protein RadC